MRKMIVVGAVLAITSAQAAEELKFGDVNYFLKQGEMNLLVDLNSAYEKETIDEIIEKRGLVTNGAFGYAFTDRLNAYLGLSYAYDVESENKTTGTNADFKNDGLANPALALNYRFLNQNEARYNVDFGAVLRYGIEDAERGRSYGPRNSDDANFANGRDSLEINARMGRKWNEANEWQLAAGVVYNNDGEYTQNTQAGDLEVDEESSLDYFARATYQYRPVNEFMVLVSAQANYVGETENEGTGYKFEGDAHLDLDFRFTAKYLITENFIGKFNYGMSRNAEFDAKIDGASKEIQKRRENFLGLGVEFLF